MVRLLRLLVVFAFLASSASVVAQTTSLSVMSYNVWFGEDDAAGRQIVADTILASGADIVGAQELRRDWGQQVADLLGWHYYEQNPSDGTYDGPRILSRFPIMEGTTGGHGARIEIRPGQSVYVFNTHLVAAPYGPDNFRDGLITTEAQAIAQADAARAPELTSVLNDMAAAKATGDPVFLTGDFNEPSHLDWTAEIAAATPRTWDIEVDWPSSNRVVDAGFTDSLREVRPNVLTDPARSWSPLYENAAHDRIDFVYHMGEDVTPTGASLLGITTTDPSTDIAVDGFNSDHAAVVVDFEVPIEIVGIMGDINNDGIVSGNGTGPYETDDVTAFISYWGQQGFTPADLNFDGRTSIADWGILNQLDPAMGTAILATLRSRPIPEPSGIILVVGCAVGLRFFLSTSPIRARSE